MAKIRLRPQNKFGHRFLTAQAFWEYAQDLQIIEPSSFEGWLAFLEQERLLVPVCRIRYPAEIMHKYAVEEYSRENDSLYAPLSLPIDTDPARFSAVQELEAQIQNWAIRYRPVGKAPQYHPLDDVQPSHAEFIERQVANHPFQSWETFTVIVGHYNGHSLYENAVTTYYHYWQVFLVAEILTMRLSVYFNLDDPEIWELVSQGRVHEIAPERHRAVTYLQGLQAIREFPAFQPAFDTLAYFFDYRDWALREAASGQQGPHLRLTGAPLRTFREQEKVVATEAVKRHGTASEELLDCLRWQCLRWQEWERRGQPRVTEEYKRNIGRTAHLYSVLTGQDAEQVTYEVGDVTGHARPTLEVIFPAWIKDQKEVAARSLKHWIKPSMASMAAVEYQVSDAECDEFLDWLEREGLLQFFWYIQRMDELGGREDPISRVGLAKELEGLGTTIEHLLNHIAAHDPTCKLKLQDTLFPKIKWLWRDKPDIVINGLGPQRALTHVTSDLKASLENIDRVSAGGLYVDIVRDLLKTILIRNQGVHISLHGFIHDDLVKLLEVLLRSMVLTWKHAKVRGFI